MKKTIQFSVCTLLAMAAISGNALAKTPKKETPTPVAQEQLSIDSKVEVAYNCNIGSHAQKITVMYGIKNGEPIVAQAKVNNVISTGLFRVGDTLLNRFQSEGKDGTMWTTMPANADNLRDVDGGTLSFKQNGSNTIIAEKCKLDKAATAKLK